MRRPPRRYHRDISQPQIVVSLEDVASMASLNSALVSQFPSDGYWGNTEVFSESEHYSLHHSFIISNRAFMGTGQGQGLTGDLRGYSILQLSNSPCPTSDFVPASPRNLRSSSKKFQCELLSSSHTASILIAIPPCPLLRYTSPSSV